MTGHCNAIGNLPGWGWIAALGVLLLAGWGNAADQGVPGAEASGAARPVVIYAVPGRMRYDIDRFEAAPGERIALRLINEDDLMHNLVMLRPQADAGMAVAQAAWTMPDALEMEYLPEHPAVWKGTRLLQPYQEETLIFEAPEAEGEYPFICTFPGHWMTMRGIMEVTREERGLRNVRYAFFDGQAKKMPEFSELEPDEEGVAPDGRLIDMAPFRGMGDFSVVFEGDLVVPRAGKYTFEQQSDGGSRVLLDGKNLIDRGMRAGDAAAQPVLAEVDLEAGTHRLRYEYYDFDKAEQVVLAWSGPGVAKTFLSRQRLIEVSQPVVLEVGSEPRVDRVVLPGAPAKSIAVGLPGGVSFVVDTTAAAVPYAWKGGYLDVAPDRVHRGGKECVLLGERVSAGLAPLGAMGVTPGAVSFRGYRRSGPAGPEFLFDLDGRPLVLSARVVEGGLEVSYRNAGDEPALGGVRAGGQPAAVNGSGTGYDILIPLP